MHPYSNMDTFCKLLTVLVIAFIIYPETVWTGNDIGYTIYSPEPSDSSCQFVPTENKTIEVCWEQLPTSDEINNESDGAPSGSNITCVCTMERSQNITFNVTISSREISDGAGIQSQISKDGSQETNNAIPENKTKTIVLQNTANITLSNTSDLTPSAFCLSLKAGASSANFTVKCRQHGLAEEDTNKREKTEQSSTISELPTTRSSTPQPVDQGNTNTDSLQTVLIPVIAASAAAVLLATIVAAVIICRKRRRRTDQSSESIKMETTANRTRIRNNPGYDYAEECPFNNLSRPAKQQRTLQTIAQEDHATDTYVEIVELGQQSSWAEPRNDTYTIYLPSKGAKRSETETVYNTVGVVDNADVATENVYSTAGVCAEGVYNTLNETLNAKIASENVYGASAGAVF